jgi:hypothetical protein
MSANLPGCRETMWKKIHAAEQVSTAWLQKFADAFHGARAPFLTITHKSYNINPE